LQAATAIWDGDKLTIYEESQAIFNMRDVIAQMFGFAERECARDHEVWWLWFRQQALAVDALSAGLCGRETVRQTGQADPQPQDDISISRPSSAHAATRAAGRHAGR